jgi:dolichol-phosphate mannosyltransferase
LLKLIAQGEEDVRNERVNVQEEVFARLGSMDFQVIYVNDGSNDHSMEMMLGQCKDDPRFSVISLSRNFGHQAAISAGLANATDDAVILMDGDLQDPPELIPDLLKHWQDGAQVVRAERRSRQETGLRRVGFELFHSFFRWISDFPIPAQTGVFGLMDKKAVSELNRFTEKNRFFPGLRTWIGFREAVLYYDRQGRAAGEPKQSLKRLVKYALDAVFSFSYKPLKVMTAAGILISGAGFILACVFIIRRLSGIEIAQTGFTTLVTLVLFLGGVQLIAIGLIGEYLARMHFRMRDKPTYVVRSTTRRE